MTTRAMCLDIARTGVAKRLSFPHCLSYLYNARSRSFVKGITSLKMLTYLFFLSQFKCMNFHIFTFISSPLRVYYEFTI